VVVRKYKTVSKQRLWEKINAAKGLNGCRNLARQYLSPGFRRAMVELSPEFYLMYYLGFRLPVHQRKWVDLWKVQFLLELAPRDHGKSWIFSYGKPLYQIYAGFVRSKCLYVPERFLQVSKTDEQASKYADQVRETIETNTWLMEDFGDIRDPKHWLKGYFSCARKTGGSLEKDHTYEKVGVLGGITGGHFDDINLDDPLDDENTKTPERMDAIENWFWGTVWNLREVYTRFCMVGTRKNRRDLYNTCLQSPLWKHNVEKAIIKYPMIPDPANPDKLLQGWLYRTDTGRHVNRIGDLKGEETIVDVELLSDDYIVLWPSTAKVDDDGNPVIDPATGKQMTWGWGIRELLMDRVSQGSQYFDREKQNEISGGEEAIFHKDWLNFFNTDELYYNTTDGYTYLVPQEAA
jgi:hypothetical protein